MTAKIDDFGQKIGGARKDYGKNPLCVTDLLLMNGNEKSTLVKRDNIFAKPDFKVLFNDGADPSVLWYINQVRIRINPKPVLYIAYAGKEDEALGQYVESVSKVRDKLLTLRKEEDITKFKDWFFSEFYKDKSTYYVAEKNIFDRSAFSAKTLRAVQFPVEKCRAGELKDLLGVPVDKIGEVVAEYAYAFLPYDGVKVKWERMNLMTEEGNKDEDVLTYLARGCKKYFYKNKTTVLNNAKKETGYVALNLTESSIVAASIPEKSLEKIKAALVALCQKQYDLSKKRDKELNVIKKKGKTAFKTEYLKDIVREGAEDYAGKLHLNASIDEDSFGQMSMCFDETPSDVTGHAQGQDYLDTFGFKGGEFGNWVNQRERQKCLDFGFNALKDLANLLDIQDRDISLGGNLNIAFGARGRGSAAAHYEPVRQVINLTRLSGAGSLAHEWFHALDHYYAYHDKGKNAPFILYSQQRHYDRSVFTELIDSMKTKRTEDGKMLHTDFFIGSQKMDNAYRVDGNGYWSSDTEMLARAFACYIEDKMKEKGIRSDYLSNHADTYGDAVPHGDERKVINQKFDSFFDDLRERGILHKREYLKNYEKRSLDSVKKMVSDTRNSLAADKGMNPTHSNNGR